MKKQKGENLLKIRVNVSKKRYKEVEEELRLAGFEIVDEAEFLLSECNQYAEYLSCKKQDSSYHVPVSEIIFIESMGHDILIHAGKDTYRCREALCRLESSLNQEEFLRVSNSVIIAKKKVKKIKHALSQKFIVTLEGGHTVDVTRTYYYVFKSAFGI